MSDKPIESWRARAAVAEALDAFNSSYMQEVWGRALARRESDPQGAVTSARTLLESVCKHILDAAQKEFREGLPLPGLYKLTAEVLEIAPNENTAPILKQLFESCSELIESIGRLRNELSDSHGRGPFGTMPDWRHAELAVNLSGAMATYLAAIWKGRQPTVADVIQKFIANAEQIKPLGHSNRYTLQAAARSPLGEVVASKLQVADLRAYAESKIGEGRTPMTLSQHLSFIRTALGPTSEHIFDRAAGELRSLKLVGKSTPRTRRPTSHELERLMRFFEKQGEDPRTKIPMAVITEFALYTGRRLGEICGLKWKDFDRKQKTCIARNVTVNGRRQQDHEFPLLGRAYEIVMQQTGKDADRIFPYGWKSASQSYADAKRRLGIVGLTFNDNRRECAIRLAKEGYKVEDISKVVGRKDLNTLRRDIEHGLAQEKAE